MFTLNVTDEQQAEIETAMETPEGRDKLRTSALLGISIHLARIAGRLDEIAERLGERSD